MAKCQPLLLCQDNAAKKKAIPARSPLISILRSPVSSDRIILSLNEGRRIFTDSRSNLNLKVFHEIQNNTSPNFIVLCFKNKDVYALEFVQILSHFLKLQDCSSTCHDHILTATQEAYANAFLWSSLDLESSAERRPLDFFLKIEKRLQDTLYSDRYMSVYAAKSGQGWEVVIHVEGRPIAWPPQTCAEQFRGVNLIQSLADKVVFDKKGQAIRLYFSN